MLPLGRPSAPARRLVFALTLLLFAGMIAEALREASRTPRVHAGRRTPERPRIEAPLTRRILVVILDAWRRRIAFDDSQMPRLATLARAGNRGSVLTGMRTFTKPCLREMLSGTRAELRDSTRNLVADPVTEESIFSRMTAAGYAYGVVDPTDDVPALFERQWPPGSRIAIPGDPLPWDPGDPAHDALAERAAARALGDGSLRLILVHLVSVDLAGHIYRPGTGRYSLTLRRTDDRIARLASLLDLSRDTLLVIGDHGTDDGGRHGGPEAEARETAYVASGAGVRHSQRPLDPLSVADNLATLLGLCPPADSAGAPDPNWLDIDPIALKSRCDACLRDRLAASFPPARPPSRDAARYFQASAFTSEIAEAYRRIASGTGAERRAGSILVLALAAAAVAVFQLTLSRMPRSAILVLVLLAVSPVRDSIAAVLLGGLLAVRAGRLPFAARITGLAASAMLLGSAAFPLDTPDLIRLGETAGVLALAAATLALAARVRHRAELARFWLLILTSPAAALVRHFFPSDQIPGDVVVSVMLTDYALGTALLFLAIGIWSREPLLFSGAWLALGGCLFHGWPIVVLVLLGCSATFGPEETDAKLGTAEALWAPMAMLAMLRAVNGGYGFSRIDLSLSTLGLPGRSDIDYRWAGAVILLSYAVPLLLSLAIAQRVGRRSPAEILPELSGVLLLFSALDLAFIALPELPGIPSIRFEEVLAFDLVLALLVLAFAALRRLLRAAPRGPAPALSVALRGGGEGQS